MVPKKVLIVAASNESRIRLGQMFSAFNFEVTQAKNGSDAVEIYEENPCFDLVAVSLDLPGAINGFTVAKLVRQFQVAKRPFIVGMAPDPSKYANGKKVSGMQDIDAYVLNSLVGTVLAADSAGLSVVKGGKS